MRMQGGNQPTRKVSDLSLADEDRCWPRFIVVEYDVVESRMGRVEDGSG